MFTSALPLGPIRFPSGLLAFWPRLVASAIPFELISKRIRKIKKATNVAQITLWNYEQLNSDLELLGILRFWNML
jgi:hypothetical protein